MLRPLLLLGSVTLLVGLASCSTTGDELFGESTGSGDSASQGAQGPGGPGPGVGGGSASGNPQSAGPGGAGPGGAGPGGPGPGPGGAGPGPGQGGGDPGPGAGGKNVGGGSADDIGCSDGTREYFADVAQQPDIAGCDGAFQVPGTTTPDSFQPLCGRQAGNDGMLPGGDGCTVEDLCAKGWHVCLSNDDVAQHSTSGECEPVGEALFYLTRQSQDGQGDCVPNAVNNLVGCGSIGEFSPSNCNPLSRYMRYSHCQPSPAWYCGDNPVPDGTHEADIVFKINAQEGGVICCRD